MNYWDHAPTRDEVLDKIYEFLRLLSLNEPAEAEKRVRVGSMSKFRDALHYHIADYMVMVFEDTEFMGLPDDFSISISDPAEMDENHINPRFSGNLLTLENGETIDVNVGFEKEVIPISIRFMVYQMEDNFYLNLMKVERV